MTLTSLSERETRLSLLTRRQAMIETMIADVRLTPERRRLLAEALEACRQEMALYRPH